MHWMQSTANACWTQGARSNALPIVVITGSGDTDLEASLIDAGADDYLRKPIDPTRMLARVRAALRRAAN